MKAERRTYDDWLKTRPTEVRRLAAELQLAPGAKIGGRWFLGFSEWTDGGVGLIVTPLDPFARGKKAYAKAQAARQQICPACTQAKRWEPCQHEAILTRMESGNGRG